MGQPELNLIEASGWRRFPRRLDWQPIFYPVLSESYATRIAREWNTKDEASGSVGYVTRFDVDARYVRRFEPHSVGGADLVELWVQAEELDDFNDHIVGKITVIAEHRADPADTTYDRDGLRSQRLHIGDLSSWRSDRPICADRCAAAVSGLPTQ